MTKQDDYQRPRDEDFNIRVRPSVIDGVWTGEVDISIVANADNELDDESYEQVMHFCTMMCATVPLMEQDEKLRDYVHEYVISNIPEQKPQSNGVDITHEDDNIIRLNFDKRKLH